MYPVRGITLKNPIFILLGGANHPVQDPFWGTNPILGWRDGLLAVLSKVQLEDEGDLDRWGALPLAGIPNRAWREPLAGRGSSGPISAGGR